MMRKYQNELIVLGALLFALAGYLYQSTSRAQLAASLAESGTASRQVTETQTLEKVWSTKGLKKKVDALRSTLPKAKIQTFELGKQKLSAHFTGLTSQELNGITSQIASLPVHIESMQIARSGNTYTVECQCRW